MISTRAARRGNAGNRRARNDGAGSGDRPSVRARLQRVGRCGRRGAFCRKESGGIFPKPYTETESPPRVKACMARSGRRLGELTSAAVFSVRRVNDEIF